MQNFVATNIWSRTLFIASPLVANLVEAGRLGQKSGSGFYSYNNRKRRPEIDPELAADNTTEALERLRYLIVALPVIAYAIVMLLMWRYPISRESQHELRGIIEERERLALSEATES